MPLGIVPQIPCQHIFVQSEPGVPRTFVVDCTELSFKKFTFKAITNKKLFYIVYVFYPANHLTKMSCLNYYWYLYNETGMMKSNSQAY